MRLDYGRPYQIMGSRPFERRVSFSCKNGLVCGEVPHRNPRQKGRTVMSSPRRDVKIRYIGVLSAAVVAALAVGMQSPFAQQQPNALTGPYVLSGTIPPPAGSKI